MNNDEQRGTTRNHINLEQATTGAPPFTPLPSSLATVPRLVANDVFLVGVFQQIGQFRGGTKSRDKFFFLNGAVGVGGDGTKRGVELLPIHVQLQQHPYRALEFQPVQFVVRPGPGTTLARHDGGVVLHSRHGLVPGAKRDRVVLVRVA